MKCTFLLTALALAPVALAAPQGTPEGLQIVDKHKKEKNETKHHKEKHHKDKHHKEHKNKTEKHHKNQAREVTKILL